MWAALAAFLPALALAGSEPSAEVLLRQGRIDEALEQAIVLVREHPEDVAAQELMVDLLLTVGESSRAESRALARMQAAPEDPDAHYLLGRARVDPIRSRESYEAALRLAPDHARSHMGMGSLHEAASQSSGNPARLTDALDAYTRAVQFDSGLAEAWLGRARVLLRMGRREQALEVAREGLDALPDEPSLALVVAELDPAKARRVLERALEGAGPDPQLHAALAKAYLAHGQASRAVVQADQALALNPDQSEARVTRAIAREVVRGELPGSVIRRLIAARQEPDALASLPAYTAIVASAPRSAMARLGRAGARGASGDKSGELDDLVAAAALDPNNDEVAGVAGLALLAAGRGSDAVAPLQAALSARPWDASLGLGLARALQAAGHPVDARLLLERVASSHPRHVDVQLAYVQALLDGGNHEMAYGVAKIAMQLTLDPRLVVAFVKVAPLAGQAAEAAAVLEPLAKRSGSAQLELYVSQLRSMAKPTTP